MKNCFLITALLALISTISAETATIATFHVGDATTKLIVATVDVESNSFEVIHEESTNVGYAEDLKGNQSKEFSEAIKAKGLAALQTLREIALEKGAIHFLGFATGAFREASNAQAFIEEMSKEELGISLLILDVDAETKLMVKDPALELVMRYADSSQDIRFSATNKREWVRLEGEVSIISTTEELEELLGISKNNEAETAHEKPQEKLQDETKPKDKMSTEQILLYGALIIAFVIVVIFKR